MPIIVAVAAGAVLLGTLVGGSLNRPGLRLGHQKGRQASRSRKPAGARLPASSERSGAESSSAANSECPKSQLLLGQLNLDHQAARSANFA